MNIVESEKKFHNYRFGAKTNPRIAAAKYYSIAKGGKRYFDKIISERVSPGQKLLEYGCGTGGEIAFFHRLGFMITGIDISEEGIRKAKDKAAEKSIPARYHVMNAEQTTFPTSEFDMIVGTGIIHHLDLKKALKEISRILNKDGTALFLEPMGHNIFINLYRKSTPSMRTKDEHPLRTEDITLLKSYFEIVDTRYFTLFTFLGMPFRRTILCNFVCRMLEAVDDTFFRFLPFLRKYAWIVVIDLRKPIKQ